MGGGGREDGGHEGEDDQSAHKMQSHSLYVAP